VQPTCHVIYFFFSMFFDNAACNPHTLLSISFPQCCLTMWCATHMPHRLFLPSMLLDNVVCNPHAALSISFPQCCLMTQCATHTPCPSGKCSLSPGCPETAQGVLETQRHQRCKATEVALRARSKMLTSLRRPGSILGHPGPL